MAAREGKPQYKEEKTPDQLIDSVRQKLVARGARGINGIKRTFKVMDDNNSKTLDPYEFTKALKDYRIPIAEEEYQTVFNLFDRDGNGEIDYDEFLRAIVVSIF